MGHKHRDSGDMSSLKVKPPCLAICLLFCLMSQISAKPNTKHLLIETKDGDEGLNQDYRKWDQRCKGGKGCKNNDYNKDADEGLSQDYRKWDQRCKGEKRCKNNDYNTDGDQGLNQDYRKWDQRCKGGKGCKNNDYN